MSDSKNLKSLGSQGTKYETKVVNPKLLESFNNLHPKSLYLVPFVQERDEFTSLCPKTGQPDHAKLEIIYVPRVKMVESKSLKLYLFSFRESGEFHEDVINRITNDLYNLLNPYYIRVYGDFAARGGLAIKPLVARYNEVLLKKELKLTLEGIKELVNNWDNIKK